MQRGTSNNGLFGPCVRCGAEGINKTASVFNKDWICPVCEPREKSHPQYPAAKAAEEAAVRAGNYKFSGMGCPPDLYLPAGRA
jgi:hypothetical protein